MPVYHRFAEIADRLDDGRLFNSMIDSPYYRDAVYEQFSDAEYQRRYAALRALMRRRGLDCLIVPGGPNHWSFGAGMLWLSGHWEWHAIANYVVFPLDGEPTLVYSMGGTHAEAVRRASYIKDVRPSRLGRFAEVIAERIKELGLERGRIGLVEIDPRFHDYLPVNQYHALRAALPEATFTFEPGVLHELVYRKSPEELACIRKAGELCTRAMEALAARCRPGVTEYQLKAAAAAAILEHGGDVDFLIIGSTSMENPALIFGNPRPSGRMLQEGDIVIMELAAGYRGYTAQIGSPVCLGPPPAWVRRFFDELVLPGFLGFVEVLRPGTPLEALRQAGTFYRQHGAQSRPIHVHGIDFVSSLPHIYTDHIEAEPFEQELQPGMVLVVEPNAVSADGRFGMFFGHTFIITDDGHECVDSYPWELTVV
ncbi:MAG TPA: Xaa-Pro peptidase family protein [Chloroflexota bacterium]|nr:Xaa-Pro peptidase family protein [Chloroflexota bacterium]